MDRGRRYEQEARDSEQFSPLSAAHMMTISFVPTVERRNCRLLIGIFVAITLVGCHEPVDPRDAASSSTVNAIDDETERGMKESMASPSTPPSPTTRVVRTVEQRLGTFYRPSGSDDQKQYSTAPTLRDLPLPTVPFANAIWGSTGVDDLRESIWEYRVMGAQICRPAW